MIAYCRTTLAARKVRLRLKGEAVLVRKTNVPLNLIVIPPTKKLDFGRLNPIVAPEACQYRCRFLSRVEPGLAKPF